jgi:hypothetical protein
LTPEDHDAIALYLEQPPETQSTRMCYEASTAITPYSLDWHHLVPSDFSIGAGEPSRTRTLLRDCLCGLISNTEVLSRSSNLSKLRRGKAIRGSAQGVNSMPPTGSKCVNSEPSTTPGHSIPQKTFACSTMDHPILPHPALRTRSLDSAK